MLDALGNYWYIAFGVLATLALLRWQSRQRGCGEGLIETLRRNINRHGDPESPLYDPGLPGRQFLLLALGLPLIAVVLVVVWLLQS